MPFTDVVERVSTRPDQDPCSVRLRRRKGGRPAFILGLRKVLIEKVKWEAGNVVLSLGTGDDADKIRIRYVGKADGTAVVRPLRSGGVIDFGFIAAFGMTSRVKTGVDAKIIDAKTLEVTLPAWEKIEEDRADEDDEDEAAAAEPPAAIRTTPRFGTASNGHQTLPPLPVIETLGVQLRGETLTFNAKKLSLSDRQARMLAPMVKQLTSIIPTAKLIEVMGIPASGGAGVVSDEFFALESAVQKIGLRIRFIPKIGYCLSKA